MKNFIFMLEDSGDGSGDLMLQITTDLLAETGLHARDDLDCVVDGDKLILAKRGLP